MNFFVSFFVPGIPAPGGSKKAFPIYRKNGAGERQFTGKVVVTDAAGQRNKDWRASVAMIASEKMRSLSFKPIQGAFNISLTFTFLRPASHCRSDGVSLRKGQSPYHVSKPDVLKIARSTEDAMTGICYVDDKLAVTMQLNKGYGPAPGCLVEITALEVDQFEFQKPPAKPEASPFE